MTTNIVALLSVGITGCSVILASLVSRYPLRNRKESKILQKIDIDFEIKRRILVLLGQYGLDRIMIYKFYPRTNPDYMSSVIEETQNGISRETSTNQNLLLSRYNYLLKVMKDDSGFFCDDISELRDNEVHSWFESLGVKSVYAIPIYHKNDLVGFISAHYVKSKKKYSKELYESMLLEACKLSCELFN